MVERLVLECAGDGWRFEVEVGAVADEGDDPASDLLSEELNLNVVVREVLGLMSSVTGTEIDVAFEAADPLPAVRGGSPCSGRRSRTWC